MLARRTVSLVGYALFLIKFQFTAKQQLLQLVSRK